MASKEFITFLFLIPTVYQMNIIWQLLVKPYIPLIEDQKSLRSDMTYIDSTGGFPKKYIEPNLLDYYVDRDIFAIKFLQKQKWISKNKLVVAGHSEGSTIAAKLAMKFPRVSKLIYAGGNPLGRILTIIEQGRVGETDSTQYAENTIKRWKNIVDSSTKMNTKLAIHIGQLMSFPFHQFNIYKN